MIAVFCTECARMADLVQTKGRLKTAASVCARRGGQNFLPKTVARILVALQNQSQAEETQGITVLARSWSVNPAQAISSKDSVPVDKATPRPAQLA
jgi:hypothetical protein